MSARDDRIPVPTNGHRPPGVALPLDPGAASSDPATADPATAEPAAADATIAAPVPPAAPDDDELAEPPRVIVTPGQATVVGFGIIAGLILVLLGRRRGRRD